MTRKYSNKEHNNTPTKYYLNEKGKKIKTICCSIVNKSFVSTNFTKIKKKKKLKLCYWC